MYMREIFKTTVEDKKVFRLTIKSNYL